MLLFVTLLASCHASRVKVATMIRAQEDAATASTSNASLQRQEDSWPWESQCETECNEARSICIDEAWEKYVHCNRHNRGGCSATYKHCASQCNSEWQACFSQYCAEQVLRCCCTSGGRRCAMHSNNQLVPSVNPLKLGQLVCDASNGWRLFTRFGLNEIPQGCR
mmetsp:Transcript_99940/g.158165  ORF Transcript_99940/g.158165 Transcript_99940/m.158165 type:complete len:165 (-) Transcript_99940:152-646(-)